MLKCRVLSPESCEGSSLGGGYLKGCYAMPGVCAWPVDSVRMTMQVLRSLTADLKRNPLRANLGGLARRSSRRADQVCLRQPLCESPVSGGLQLPPFALGSSDCLRPMACRLAKTPPLNSTRILTMCFSKILGNCNPTPVTGPFHL